MAGEQVKPGPGLKPGSDCYDPSVFLVTSRRMAVACGSVGSDASAVFSLRLPARCHLSMQADCDRCMLAARMCCYSCIASLAPILVLAKLLATLLCIIACSQSKRFPRL